jgi:hypothetical protein
MNKYIVSLQPNPSREELEWAWKFTVFARAKGHCQHCGKQVRLDACHIKNREQFPELQYEPENGIALCRNCHLEFDHRLNNRPSGRVKGYHHSQETKQLMSIKSKEAHNTTEYLREASIRTLKQWDKQGRKPDRNCEQCGQPLSRKLISINQRFCSNKCRYKFQTGKPRSGW